MPGENLDLSSDSRHEPTADQRQGGRRFVGVHFICCDVYSRVYVNRDESAYVGHCPRCSKPIEIRIGPGGTASRFFTAY